MIESPPYAEYDDKNWLQPTEATPFPRILDIPNQTVRQIGVNPFWVVA
jgi:phytanoyl-CoA hydroxylase